MVQEGTLYAIAFHHREEAVAEFGEGYYTRVRRGVAERVRKYKRKRKRQVADVKRRAFKEYKKGKPGLLEKTGVIPHRKYAKYGENNRYSQKTIKSVGLRAYREGKPGLLEKTGIIPNRRG